MPASADFLALLPTHLVLGGIVTGLLLLLPRSRAGVLPLVSSLAWVVAAALSAFWLARAGTSSTPFGGHLAFDAQTYMVQGALLLLAVPVLLMAREEFAEGEFPLLLLCSLYGLALLPAASSALVVFLGLELLAIPSYALIVLAYRRPQAAESALKYLVLSGAASATLLMGFALVYGLTGSLSVTAFAQAVGTDDLLARTAVVLVVAGLFVKGAVWPFHGWAPDAYEGASVPVTAYLATLSKAAVLVVALRLFAGVEVQGSLLHLLAALPLASIVWGNLAAMRQDSLRRMIAYSSIAHAGYLFYAFLGAPDGRGQAVAFYLVVYAASNLLAFAVLPAHDDDATRDRLGTLDGLASRDPLSATLIAVAMLSLAGLPPLPGFTAKFVIFRSVVAAGHTWWAVAGLVGSFLGLFFYLRVIMRMFMGSTDGVRAAAPAAWSARLAGWLCAAATLALTLAPSWVLERL
ncbi:MAG: NADH-quinone oxidoreductase subunit N [Gemmatimonadetes bacterium]|nr:NADH-quinone oxidoreductase subunit N [Gemmatimonadota bacterium]